MINASIGGLNHTKDKVIGLARFRNAGGLLYHLSWFRRTRPSHCGAGVEAKLDKISQKKMELFNCIS